MTYLNILRRSQFYTKKYATSKKTKYKGLKNEHDKLYSST